MKFRTPQHPFRLGLIALAVLSSTSVYADPPANTGLLPLATGQYITPTFVPGAVQQYLNPGLPAYPNFVAGEAVKSQLSPDGTTLAILCAGQNSLYKPDGTLDVANSTQYVFLYDVSGANRAKPVLTQVIKQTNAHVGLAFGPDSQTLYAAGGVDDAVYVYTKSASTWSQAAKIALGHASVGIGLSVQPNAGGLALSADGKTLVVANNYNDSISVVDTATRTVRYEHDLRPYFVNNEGMNGGVGGTFPFAVVVKGNGVAYVSSDRDREIVAVDVSSASGGHLIGRIKLDGNALGMTLDANQARLYVAQDNADQVAVIDTTSNSVVAKIDARAPSGVLTNIAQTGVATFNVTLSRDGTTLYAVNAGANSVAVIPLSGTGANTVTGLIPTAYEPHDITFSSDGGTMYIVNGKNSTGPNPDHLSSQTASLTTITYPGGNVAASAAANASNEYQFQLERASLVSAPVPSPSDLPLLTAKVAQNNSYSATPVAGDATVMAFLRSHIKHVIYIVKENRTFDQILGDLSNGADGDPSRTQFGKRITPNFHALASRFVTLDNFMDPGDGSMDGWSWALQGRVTNTETITQQLNYAFVNRGLSYESEGSNRNVPVNLPDRRPARRRGGTAEHDELHRRVERRARRHGQPARRRRQPRLERCAVRDPARLYLRRRADRGRYGPQLRLPGQQHRQHRHEGQPDLRSVRIGRHPGRAARHRVDPADRRLLPRLRPGRIRTCGATTSGSASSISSSRAATCRACRSFASATTTWAASPPRSAG